MSESVDLSILLETLETAIDNLDAIKKISKSRDLLAIASLIDSRKKSPNTAEEDKVANLATSISRVKIVFETLENNISRLKRQLERESK